MPDAADKTAERCDRVNGINLRGTRASREHQPPRMRNPGPGAMVNCSSPAELPGCLPAPPMVTLRPPLAASAPAKPPPAGPPDGWAAPGEMPAAALWPIQSRCQPRLGVTLPADDGCTAR